MAEEITLSTQLTSQGPSHNKPQLTIVHQNIDWLTNKSDQTSHFAQNTTLDIVVLTEHGLSSENLQNARLEWYKFIGVFARQNHIKEGEVVFAKNELANIIKVVATSGPTQN